MVPEAAQPVGAVERRACPDRKRAATKVTSADENCDGNGACTGDAIWSLGSNEPFVLDDAHSVAVDPLDDVLVAGIAGSTYSDMFLAKIGP